MSKTQYIDGKKEMQHSSLQFNIAPLLHHHRATAGPGPARQLHPRFLLTPRPPQNHTRMHGGDGDGGDGDHGALEDHEGDLVVGEGAVKAAAELGDAEDGADVDCQGC